MSEITIAVVMVTVPASALAVAPVPASKREYKRRNWWVQEKPLHFLEQTKRVDNAVCDKAKPADKIIPCRCVEQC